MRLFCLATVLLWTPSSTAIFGRRLPFQKAKTSKISRRPEDPMLSSFPTTRRFNRFLDKLFDDADVNHDGTVCFSEAYEMVLKVYVNINRQAPIPPPTRERVAQLYLKADASQTNRLSREEFKTLVNTLGRRALSRLVAHKLVTLLGAPLLATILVEELSTHEWPRQVAHTVVPDVWHDKFLPTITSQTFQRTLIIVVCVVTLGNIVLNIVNRLLDMSLAKDAVIDDEGRLKSLLKSKRL